MSASPNPTFQLRASRSFVYGWFRWQTEGHGSRLLEKILLAGNRSEPNTAIEILREYGPSEMLGRIHVKEAGANWERLSPDGASNCGWYEFYLQNHRDVFFEMKGSGLWEVVNFRNESDETGPYLAVALSFQPSKLPAWLLPRDAVRPRAHSPSGRRRHAVPSRKRLTPSPGQS